MWVDRYGFEIFMGDQEERKEGDHWIDEDDSKTTMPPEEFMKGQPGAKAIAEHREKPESKNKTLF